MSHYLVLQKKQGELLTFVGNPEVVEPYMFGKDLFLSVFYCLCHEMDIYTCCSLCHKSTRNTI